MGDDHPADLPKSLLNADGQVLDADLASTEAILAGLGDTERIAYRDRNAHEIATHGSPRLLVVAGPGSGKSHLFLSRISHWVVQHPDEEIYVASFVRKLVADLQADVQVRLNEDEQRKVTVSTLHGLARSIIERARGTSVMRLRPGVQMITEAWQAMVWQDAQLFLDDLPTLPTHRRFVEQLNTEDLDNGPAWRELRKAYARLNVFYNAVGFAEMIVIARRAITERPGLNAHLLWIIDEYQDFNLAEDHLIREITGSARGVLIAGDDEQALYQTLKASTPDIIIGYYQAAEFANAMLPYCSRCSYHVCLAASAFIAAHREANAVTKVYLPLETSKPATKVQVVATRAPAQAVDYIIRFVESRRSEVEAHQAAMQAGKETEPWLLVLSPTNELDFYAYQHARERLQELVETWSTPEVVHSSDYRKVLMYCAVSKNPQNNFAVRKVLDDQGASPQSVHELIVQAMEQQRSLAAVLGEKYGYLLELCDNVRELALSGDRTPEEKAMRLGTVINIQDIDGLAAELTTDPITDARASGTEDIEAIETAGIMRPIELMTIVRSKGLSAQHVIVVGCDDVNLLRVPSLAFFVALTRARSTLHLLVSLQAGGATDTHPYLRDLPEDHCEFFAFTKGEGLESLPTGADLVEKLRRWRWGLQQGRRPKKKSGP